MSTTFPVHATVTASFSATPEKVFGAWLDTNMIARFMFGPNVREEEIVSLTNEPVVGGRFSYVVRRRGVDFNHTGKYLAIDNPRHLVFTWAVEQGSPGTQSQIVIDIAPVAGGCQLTLVL